jgi:ketosteroid isomerase-like protein
MNRISRTFLAGFLAASLAAGAVNSQILSSEQSQSIQLEIQRILDGYREAMLSRDYDAMIALWSDSQDFVFAGDGRILGGIDAWIRQTTRDYEETQSWEIWDWQNVQILVLSDGAASATLEFRYRWVDAEGVTQNSRGAWTYVFRKEGDQWKVVHTNGTHVSL